MNGWKSLIVTNEGEGKHNCSYCSMLLFTSLCLRILGIYSLNFNKSNVKTFKISKQTEKILSEKGEEIENDNNNK